MRSRSSRLALVCAAGATALLTTALAVPRAEAAATSTPPYVQGTQTVPTYDYSSAIHQSVYVTSTASSTGGTPDRVRVDIIRPATPAGVLVPVIMDASPYYLNGGRGNQNQTKTYDASGVIASMPLFYDNYFVPRGYAVAEVDDVGTANSTGCFTSNGPTDIAGLVAAINWLNGSGSASDLSGQAVSATSWTNGSVGMIGKSDDGALADEVAATGVAGLKTIVPIAGVSTWYGYTRFNGVDRFRNYETGYQSGEDANANACSSVTAADQSAASDSTGNYNAYFAARNAQTQVANFHASVFGVQGLNDTNVHPGETLDLYNGLAPTGVARKLWLTQVGHVDPFDVNRSAWVSTLQAWFDYWLQGLQNGILGQPAVTVQQANGTFINQSQYPAAGTAYQATTLSSLVGTATRSFTDNPNLSESQATANPTSSVRGRTVFLARSQANALNLSGSPYAILRVKLNKPDSELSARLVDYGQQTRVDWATNEGITTLSTQSCWGESSSVDSACYYDTSINYTTTNVDVLDRGYVDADHATSLTSPSALTPGQWYSIKVPIDPTQAVIAAGHQLGLVVTGTADASPATTGAAITVDPTQSALYLPVTGSTGLGS